MSKNFQLVIRQGQSIKRQSFKTASGALRAKNRLLSETTQPIIINYYAPGEAPETFTEQDVPISCHDKKTDFYSTTAWRNLRTDALARLPKSVFFVVRQRNNMV
ncbi:hypothetical protein P2G88_18120 [Aliiglaciecola sp. CAU 1673]|uniref:hypothetical protein n=1 Tax=Aliiglaciecola sp. CAU 1673 TaxID=3032595 RepID=UPI0023DC321D|nr:hypothetical protein [Aliiglaciecola sp. CAU 1673]MDF2180175.1 hypothetical protein [Aliiglaciecola sp. CAU 1673]